MARIDGNKAANKRPLDDDGSSTTDEEEEDNLDTSPEAAEIRAQKRRKRVLQKIDDIIAPKPSAVRFHPARSLLVSHGPEQSPHIVTLQESEELEDRHEDAFPRLHELETLNPRNEMLYLNSIANRMYARGTALRNARAAERAERESVQSGN